MNENILLSVFVAVEGAHAFSAFMPSWFTVQKFADGDEDKQRLRSGYIPAAIFNLVLAAVVSKIIKSPLPLLVAALVMLFMIAMYEGAIGMNPEA